MGACDFSLIQIGKYKTVREAYKDAVQDALYEDGHDRYNGTISTTDTLSHPYYGEVPRFNTKAFSRWEEKNLERLDKRECTFTELKGAVLKRLKDNSPYKGKKGVKGYYFFGLAAY